MGSERLSPHHHTSATDPGTCEAITVKENPPEAIARTKRWLMWGVLEHAIYIYYYNIYIYTHIYIHIHIHIYVYLHVLNSGGTP